MADDGVLREVLDDLRHEAHRRRVQLLAALAYLVMAGGVLYLFSSIGEDSGSFEDVHDRTVLAGVGTGLTAAGVVLCVLTLVAERRVRLDPTPGREPGALPSRGRLVGATVLGATLVVLGLVALGRWT